MNKKFLIGLLLFGLIAVNVAGESEITEDDNVLVLTNENFQSALDKYENLLVKFYAPCTCIYLNPLAPYKNIPKKLLFLSIFIHAITQSIKLF